EAEVEPADVGDQVLVVGRQQLDPVGEEGEVVVEGPRQRGRGQPDRDRGDEEEAQRRPRANGRSHPWSISTASSSSAASWPSKESTRRYSIVGSRESRSSTSPLLRRE